MPGKPSSRNSKKSTTPESVNISHTCECVTLTKGQHRWTFSCHPGQEQSLLMRLAELAKQEDVPFDWFDAALVSHQLRNRLLPGLARNDPTPPNTTTG